jgi:hypothetical protein
MKHDNEMRKMKELFEQELVEQCESFMVEHTQMLDDGLKKQLINDEVWKI